VFADASGAPNLLCMLANSSAPTPIRFEKRGDLALATWRCDGEQFLVLGRRLK
jgi:hypothetical protein